MSTQVGDRLWEGGSTSQAGDRDPAEFEVSLFNEDCLIKLIMKTPKHPQIVRLLPRFETYIPGSGICSKRRAIQADVEMWEIRREEE